jgi:hypothetical protein
MTTWKTWKPSARNHRRCCRALLPPTTPGPALCPECAADRCRRGRRHRRKVYVGGCVQWVPVGTAPAKGYAPNL